MVICKAHNIKATFYSVVPSPYQRDIFYALSQYPFITLKVYYFEPSCIDSPWPTKELFSYEKVLSGFRLNWQGSRFHLNWHLPKLCETDIIILNGYMNLTAQLILSNKQKPCIFWGEKILGAKIGLKSILQKKLSQGLNQCDAIAAVGLRASEDYRQRFPAKQIFNIPYHCDLSSFQQNIPNRPRPIPTILFCGQMIARKGVDLLLQAFAALISQGLKAQLLLVGREAQLSQMLSNISTTVQSHIHYAGFQAPERLPHFFHQADIFVLPSRYDGWGVVINQALGAGLPVICSDAVGAAYDLIEPGVNGHIFPMGDVACLTQLLVAYLQNPEMIITASQASLKKSSLWSANAGAQKWVDVIQQVLN